MKPSPLILLMALLASAPLALVAGTDLETKAGPKAAPEEKSIAEEKVPTPEESAEKKLKQWTVSPSYSYSFFSNGQDGWQNANVQLYYQYNRQWSLGLEVDLRDRPPTGTDTSYGGFVSYSPTDKLELHAKLMACPDSGFSANEAYSGGLQYQFMPKLALLLDYRGWNFSDELIHQAQPGLLIGITDNLSLTLRYAHGWAFSEFEYNFYCAMLNYELPEGRRLTFSFDYGTDPNLEVGLGGNARPTLSPAYTATIFFRQPLGTDVKLYTGFEYVYRMDQNDDELYQRFTPTVGLAWSF